MVNGVQYVIMDLKLLMLEWLVDNWDIVTTLNMIIYQCKLAVIINLCYGDISINLIELAFNKLIEWQNQQLVIVIQSNQQRNILNLMLKHVLSIIIEMEGKKRKNLDVECLILKHCSIIYYRNGAHLNTIWLTYVSCSYYDKCLVNECNSCPLSSGTSCSHSEDVTLDCGKK